MSNTRTFCLYEMEYIRRNLAYDSVTSSIYCILRPRIMIIMMMMEKRRVRDYFREEEVKRFRHGGLALPQVVSTT